MAMTKTREEIEILREGGRILSAALGETVKAVKPGVTIQELDAIAEKGIRSRGATPSFLGYRAGGPTPFPSTVCISRNEEVVHGPGNRDIKLREGDVVGFDIGCWYKELCTDMAMTVGVGEVSGEARSLMNVTKASLKNGIKAAKAGVPLQAIGHAIEKTIEPHGYGIVKSYVGHGVGHAVHEDPHVPNFVSKEFANPMLRAGMVLALEPMITLGTDQVELSDNDWSAITVDGSIAAHFEQTIVITESGAEVLTPFPDEV